MENRLSNAAYNVSYLQEIIPNSFCVYGTALGSLREKNIIEHDPDTDIGIFSEDFSWDYINQAVKNGWEIVAVFGMRYYGLEIALRKDGIKTDIMVFYKKDDKIINCLWDNGGRDGIVNAIVHQYDPAVFKIIHGELGAHTVRTLGLEYIESVYGKDWRIPVKKWNWKEDHLCKKTG